MVTVVAVVLRRAKLALGVVRLVVMAGLVARTTLPVPVTALRVTPAILKTFPVPAVS